MFLFQAQIHQNQPYDESLEVADGEEIASIYSPTPRVSQQGEADKIKLTYNKSKNTITECGYLKSWTVQ